MGIFRSRAWVLGGGTPAGSPGRLAVERVREEEVLILLSKEYSSKEIASQLSIGVETVGSHLKHICEKMHVCSRAEAVACYMTNKP